MSNYNISEIISGKRIKEFRRIQGSDGKWLKYTHSQSMELFPHILWVDKEENGTEISDDFYLPFEGKEWKKILKDCTVVRYESHEIKIDKFPIQPYLKRIAINCIETTVKC